MGGRGGGGKDLDLDLDLPVSLAELLELELQLVVQGVPSVLPLPRGQEQAVPTPKTR
jgi:hypothetical protein